MASSVPYIGSKITLVSNSEMRYEGILYTIDTQAATIALQSVRCFGTEGRRVPAVEGTNEVYDFIIFRGQDIKDLTVLESESAVNDPAIVSINQKPGGKAGAKGGSGAGKGQSSAGGGGDNFWGTGGSYNSGAGGGGWGGWGAANASGGYGQGGYDGGGSNRYGNSYNSGYGGGYGKGGDKGGKKGDSKGGKAGDRGKSGKGYGKDGGGGKGKGGDKGKKGNDKGSGKRSGGGGGGGRSGGGALNGIPVGELQPEENATVKKEVAGDFDVEAANTKFEKVVTLEGTEGMEERLKPLSGYDKAKSFFDSISCEATERPAESERPKMDREKARESDKETFGDTRRPPRPAGGRPGKGRRRNGAGTGKGYR